MQLIWKKLQENHISCQQKIIRNIHPYREMLYSSEKWANKGKIYWEKRKQIAEKSMQYNII